MTAYRIDPEDHEARKAAEDMAMKMPPHEEKHSLTAEEILKYKTRFQRNDTARTRVTLGSESHLTNPRDTMPPISCFNSTSDPYLLNT